MTYEEILNLGYPTEQCLYKHWNEEKQCWEKGMKCCICSNTCSARAKDFEKEGKKQYNDGVITYWK